MNNADFLIVLPRLKVQNANIISSPLTWGFPSVTAFSGFAHSLRRKLEFDLNFLGVGIVCHAFDPQVTSGFTNTFNLTRNPLTKDGETAALVEEGRAHLEVSLVFAVSGRVDSDEEEYFLNHLKRIVQIQRLAGGTILPLGTGKRHQPSIHHLSSSKQQNDDEFQQVKRRLLPGFALVHREDCLERHLQNRRREHPGSTSLDALLDLVSLNWQPKTQETYEQDESGWYLSKKEGWLVPIPIGYAGISPLYGAREVQNARDDITQFRFVESVHSLGEWISPHRLESLNQLVWYEKTDTETGLYLCQNDYSLNLKEKQNV